MRNLVYIAMVLLIVSACKSRNNTPKGFDNFYFSVETTPCFGACPIYKMEVNAMGEATLDARRFMDSIGHFKSDTNSLTVRLMMGEVKGHDWSDYKAEYYTGYSDLPSSIFVYSSAPGDTTRVQFEYEAAPESLKQLWDRIEKLRKNTEWVSQDLN